MTSSTSKSMTKEEVTQYVGMFKRKREAVMKADSGDFDHHLNRFVIELDTNPLMSDIIGALPPFDAAAWWQKVDEHAERMRRLERLDFPPNANDQLVAQLYLLRRFASNDSNALGIYGFGQMFGYYKQKDSREFVRSVILGPFCEELTERLRAAARMVSPELRELVGVPISRIPEEGKTKLFLSHKTTNKALVHRCFKLLKTLDFDPWMDDDAMTAGDKTERALLDGMDRSCAAIFFLTKEFRDDGFLETEIDYAVSQARKKGDRFKIIPLVFDRDTPIPRLLERFTWKPVDSELDAMHEIIRALPIQLGPPIWRESVANSAPEPIK